MSVSPITGIIGVCHLFELVFWDRISLFFFYLPRLALNQNPPLSVSWAIRITGVLNHVQP
jgi:hypothetical protein